MPGNWGYLSNDIYNYITNTYPNNFSVLDVGCGHGHYSKLLKSYFNVNNFDGVEIWEPYIKQYDLYNLYTNIYNVNILNFDFKYYDLIIMGDILEHLSREDGTEIIKSLSKKCSELLVIVPYYLPQGICENNPYEIHLQPDLDDKIIAEYYPELEIINYNDKEFKIRIDIDKNVYYYCAFKKKIK
jgi:SAM-dependent methyltransferase